jgi:hypothetical protein
MESVEFTSTPTRVPAALWESLQEICWRQDLRFIEDAARILGVSATEIKQRVLGTRGVVSAVVSTSGAWYDGGRCPLMIPGPGELWRRCCEPAEYNGFCSVHKKGRGMKYDNPFFAALPVRHPWRFDGAVVWVDTDGGVLTESGTLLKDVRIDVTNGVCYDDRPCPPPWKKEELIATADGAESETD